MSNFKEIKSAEFPYTPFDLKDKWMLVTAEKDGKVNTMTASWGGMGIMWNKNVVFVVIRPQRYTKEFIDRADSFSLTFFESSFKKQLGYLGKVSGRDENKIEKAGLTILHEGKVPYFEEAEIVITANKLFSSPWNETNFIDKSIVDRWYPEKDFHTLYIAEISKMLKNEHTIFKDKDLDNILL
ncbi:MAG: flavin reductase [Dysgonomonas sp.]